MEQYGNPVKYVVALRRWLWLILLAGALAAGATYTALNTQPPTYRAQALVSIGSYLQSSNPNSQDIRTGMDLAQTYAALVETTTVLQGVIDNLGLTFTVEQLRPIVDVESLRNTSLLAIGATYTDPTLAARIANETAQQLITISPTNLTPAEEAQLEAALTRIRTETEARDQAATQLEPIDEQLLQATDFDSVAILTARHNALVDQINVSTQNIQESLAIVNELRDRSNSLLVVEPAQVPTARSGANALLTSGLGALVGMIAAIALVVVLEHNDDTIRSGEHVSQAMGVPILSRIARFRKRRRTALNQLVTLHSPRSVSAEGYRTLFANLLYGLGKTTAANSTFIVTSANPREGKSVTVANLAVMVASTGYRVLLIDADFRKPSIHRIFGVENRAGITDLLADMPVPQLEYLQDSEAGSREYGEYLRQLAEQVHGYTQDLGLPNLLLMTTGTNVPDNPTQFMGPLGLREWVEALRYLLAVDVIILDTPPCQRVADATVVAGLLKAQVLLVVEPGRTEMDEAMSAYEQMVQVGAHVKGLIVNKVRPRTVGYGRGVYGQSRKTATRPEAARPIAHANGHDLDNEEVETAARSDK